MRQKQPGEEGFLTPSLLADGSGRAKVLYPEMLIGMLLEMGSGSKKTPKGGLKDLQCTSEGEKFRSRETPYCCVLASARARSRSGVRRENRGSREAGDQTFSKNGARLRAHPRRRVGGAIKWI